MFICATLLLQILNYIISGIPSSYTNSNTPAYLIGIAMEHALEQLDIHSNSKAFRDYNEELEIWSMTKEDVEYVIINAHLHSSDKKPRAY